MTSPVPFDPHFDPNAEPIFAQLEPRFPVNPGGEIIRPIRPGGGPADSDITSTCLTCGCTATCASCGEFEVF